MECVLSEMEECKVLTVSLLDCLETRTSDVLINRGALNVLMAMFLSGAATIEFYYCLNQQDQ